MQTSYCLNCLFKKIILLVIGFVLSLHFCYAQSTLDTLEFKEINLLKTPKGAFAIDDDSYFKSFTEIIESYPLGQIGLKYYFKKNNKLLHKIISVHKLGFAIDEEDIALYGNPSSNNKIIIWKLNDEQMTFFYFSLFNKNKITFLGEIYLGDANCVFCESFNFPKNRISVEETNNSFIIRFQGKSFMGNKGIIKSTLGGRVIMKDLTLEYFR